MKAERVTKSLPDASAVRVPARAPAWVVPAVKTVLLVLDLALAFAAFSVAFYLRQGGSIIDTAGGGRA